MALVKGVKVKVSKRKFLIVSKKIDPGRVRFFFWVLSGKQEMLRKFKGLGFHDLQRKLKL